MTEESSNKSVLHMEDKVAKKVVKKPHQKQLEPRTSLIRGKPKSGRFWKSEKKKFSSIIKTRGIKSSLAKKQALRDKLKEVKEASRERKAKKLEEEELRKQRRRENLKRQEENRKKSEIVQVITNSKKLKKMKKKQMRYIEKRDTTKIIPK